MLYSQILDCVGYLPSKVVSNFDLENFLDTSHNWILERTGIYERRIAPDHVDTADLAILSAKSLLAKHPKEKIDLIIVSTSTPERNFPSVACRVHQSLFCGSHIPAFDVQAACSGFVYGVDLADKLIKANAYNSILLIAAEKMSKIVDWQDRNTCILFGDGAAASIITKATKTSQSKILDTLIKSDGSHFDSLYTSKLVSSKKSECDSSICMFGQDVFKHASEKMSDIIKELLLRNRLVISDVKFFVLHQANKRIIDYIVKILHISEEQLIVTIDKHANCSAASIPMAIGDAISQGKLQKGDKIVCIGFGAGFTWGGALINW